MTTVYVVTEGSYSDYHIIGVFSEESVAEQLAERWGCDVKEYELDSLAQLIEKPMYGITMLRDGAIIHAGKSNHFIEPSAALRHRWYAGQWQIILCITCFANDEQHAAKIANEKRTQFVASGEWEEAQQYMKEGW